MLIIITPISHEDQIKHEISQKPPSV